MSRKNYGMKMTEEDIKAKITENKQRLVRQQERAKKLKESMERNRTVIKQLEYTLQKIKRSRLKNKPLNFIKRQDVSTFFTRISHFYDYLKHRLTNPLCYVRFCLILNARYCFESRSKTAGHRTTFTGDDTGVFQKGDGGTGNALIILLSLHPIFYFQVFKSIHMANIFRLPRYSFVVLRLQQINKSKSSTGVSFLRSLTFSMTYKCATSFTGTICIFSRNFCTI